MKLKYLNLVAFLLIPVLCSCSGQATTEPGVLSPGQIDSSMVDQVVKVRGKVLWVVQDPGWFGGLYLELGNDEDKIGVRIQGDIWETLTEKEKAQFKEGKTITAEGILFQAGGQPVVIFGKFSPSPTTPPATTPQASSTRI